MAAPAGLVDAQGRPGSLAALVRQHRVRVLEAIDPVMHGVGQYLVAELHVELNTPGAGRTYVRGKGGRVHTASAPGQPPARDTSALYGSITYMMVGPGHLRTGTPLIVGVWMEYGTLGEGGSVAPRPWLTVVARRTAPTVRTIILQGLTAAARGIAAEVPNITPVTP